MIGDGPGGAALAMFLSREGWSCVIAERSRFPRFHIGESLIPHTLGVFDCLVGDVLKGMTAFKDSLGQMTSPPPPLGVAIGN